MDNARFATLRHEEEQIFVSATRAARDARLKATRFACLDLESEPLE